MDAESWTIARVITGNVIAIGALVVGILSWRASHRAAKTNEDLAVSNRRMADTNEQIAATNWDMAEMNRRMADVTDQAARSSAESVRLEPDANRRIQLARFELGAGPIHMSAGVVESTTTTATNIGAHRAEQARFAIGPPAQVSPLEFSGRSVEPGKPMSTTYRPFLTEVYSTSDVVIAFRDGTGERRQTFSIYYKRTEEHGWDYDRIKETTPDAP